MTLAEDLAAAIAANDEAAIRTLLAHRTEEERAVLLPVVRPLVAEVTRLGTDGVARLGPVLLVAYGTLPVTELRKLGWRSYHLPAGVEDVLRRRSPERLAPIVEHLLDWVGGRAWSAVRALVREGVVPPPERPSYAIALLSATSYRNPADVVGADPGLLDDEVWRLFEVEGGGGDSLANYEKYGGDAWGGYFRDLAAEDAAMRRRLLDASLAALARDFAAFRAGWFSRFHESLAPSDDERAERADAYLGLLRSRVGPTVSFAVAALTRVSRAGRLPAGRLLEGIEPVLVDAPAGTAKSALQLLARAGTDADEARRAAIVATAALAHASPDVQRAAITLVGTLVPGPDEAVARALAERLPEMTASQRAAASDLLVRLGGELTVDESHLPSGADVPALTSHPSPLDPAHAVAPLGSVDELVDAGVSVIETGEPADDVERVIDAVGRFAADRPDDLERLTAALARRARTILARRESMPFSGFDARADVAAVLLAWTTRELPEPRPGYAGSDPGAGAFLSARAQEVARAAARGTPFRSVSAPSHRGGWIDPLILVERLASRPPASRLDLVAGLLRTAPLRRDEALLAARHVDGEAGAALRYALGGDEPIGPTAAWWVAAARVRTPGRDDPRVEARHPGLGPDAGLAARIAIVERRPSLLTGPFALEAGPAPSGRTPVDLPTVLLLRGTSSFAVSGRSEPAMLRWMTTIQPGYREAWAARGSATLAGNVDWWSAEWSNRVFLEPFVDPAAEIGPQAQQLIGIALGAREAGERGLAADIVRLALADGRLTDLALGASLSAAAAIGCDRPMRWALSLGEVGTASEAHACAVARAIAGVLPVLADRPPAKLVPLLRLFDELLAATNGAAAPESRDALSRLSALSGQAGRLARSVLSRG